MHKVMTAIPRMRAPSRQALQALQALAFPGSLQGSCCASFRAGATRTPIQNRNLHNPPSSVLTPSRRSTNPYAPKHRDRGPHSSETTQTDFAKLDIFQSSNVPTPATNIDACSTDGFQLNNNVIISGYDGLLLIGGEAFVWSPHKQRASAGAGGGGGGGGDGVKKDLLQLDAKGMLTLTPESLSILAVLYPKPDLLFLGTGARLWMLSKATRNYLNAELGIRVEVMDTANASSAYNMLAQERGVEHGVGAALLPIGWKGR